MAWIITAVIIFVLPFEGHCMQNLMCVTKFSASAPIEILEDSSYNEYYHPYAPWWSMFNIPCGSDYRSPLLDNWESLDVTKVRISAFNSLSQVLHSEDFDVNALNITDIFTNVTGSNNTTYKLTGFLGMDFLKADYDDPRKIEFGILPQLDGDNRLILDVTEGHYRIPDASGNRDCVYYPTHRPSIYTTTLNVANQEECFYACYRRWDKTAALYTLDGTSGHACNCFKGVLSTSGLDVSDSSYCGRECEGDASQRCGNETHLVIINAFEAVDQGFSTEEENRSMISVTLPMSGEVTLDLTSVVANDGKAYLTKIAVGDDQQWMNLRIRHSQTPCNSTVTYHSNKFNLQDNNGTVYVDRLMAVCMILSNKTALHAPLDVNLTFSKSNVIFPSRFVLQAEVVESNICEYKDVAVVDPIPDSNIDIWYPWYGNDVSRINRGGVLIHANQRPFPSPRIMVYRSANFPYVSHVEIKTTASEVHLEASSCSGNFENRSLTAWRHSNGFYDFNATLLVNSDVFTCTELLVLEINTDSVISSEPYVFQMYIMGCALDTQYSGYQCTNVVDLIASAPGFSYEDIVIHSSSIDISPAPVKPCDGSLYLTRASFAEPLIITVLLLADVRKNNLPVNYIRVVGEVDSVTIEYTGGYYSNVVNQLPSDSSTIIGDELVANFTAINMYAVRIIDGTKGTYHNITAVIIKACILNEDIFNGDFVNDTRLCEETTTTSTSTTTTTTTPQPSTTTTSALVSTIAAMASTTAMQCCACTPVKPTISVQQAEEKAEQMAKELTVDKSTLSSTIRKKTSAKDERPSATMVGSIGAILLSLTFGLVVVLDADYMYKVYKIVQKWRRLQQKLKLANAISNPEPALEPGLNTEAGLNFEPGSSPDSGVNLEPGPNKE
ncbi:uncharacterized protein [Argopecten irradians]|uniref:uncharacterized protein n=1 Tax=Argopecten irradians TaxID=31199 RepID=UPI003721AA1B